MRVRTFLVLAGCVAVFLSSVGVVSAQRGFVSLRDNGLLGSFDTNADVLSQSTPGFRDPRTIAVTPTGNKVFVDAVDGNMLHVVDTALNTQTGFAVGNGGMFGLAISPSGDRVYVNSFGSDYVAVINAETHAVIDTYPTVDPTAIAVSPDGSKLYVSSLNNGDVNVLDAASGEQVGSIVMTSARGILATPDGSKLFISDSVAKKIFAVSTATNTILGSVDGTNQTSQMAITPDGKKLYVADLEPNKVTVIDAVQNSKLTTIEGFQSTNGVAVTASGKKLYVSSGDNDTIYPVDTATDKIVPGSFPALSSPANLALTPGKAPTASFTAAIAPVGSPSTFDGSGAGTFDGTTITRYDWDFGDGIQLMDGGQKPQHTYAAAGSYTAKLTVTNSDGVSTEKVFNGVQLLRDGGDSAQTTATFTIGSSARSTEAISGSTPSVTTGSTAPKLTLLKAKKISLRGRKSLTIRVRGDVALRVVAKATITNKKGDVLKQIRPRNASISVKASRTKRLRFPLSKRSLAQLKRQLHNGQKRYLSLVLTATGATGQVVEKVRIPLGLPRKK